MRVRTLGDVHADIPIHGFKGFGEFNTCEVEGCGRTVRSRNSPWCEGHYNRVRRKGDLQPDVPLKEQRTGDRPCAVDGCGTIIPRGTLCSKHEARVRRHGDPSVVIPIEERKYVSGPDSPSWSESPSYNAIHLRTRKARGKASDHSCVDCGDKARHWSYSGPEYTTLMPYSDNPDHYQPRCVPCHSTHDREHRSS